MLLVERKLCGRIRGINLKIARRRLNNLSVTLKLHQMPVMGRSRNLQLEKQVITDRNNRAAEAVVFQRSRTMGRHGSPIYPSFHEGKRCEELTGDSRQIWRRAARPYLAYGKMPNYTGLPHPPPGLRPEPWSDPRKRCDLED